MPKKLLTVESTIRTRGTHDRLISKIIDRRNTVTKIVKRLPIPKPVPMVTKQTKIIDTTDPLLDQLFEVDAKTEQQFFNRIKEYIPIIYSSLDAINSSLEKNPILDDAEQLYSSLSSVEQLYSSLSVEQLYETHNIIEQLHESHNIIEQLHNACTIIEQLHKVRKDRLKILNDMLRMALNHFILNLNTIQFLVYFHCKQSLTEIHTQMDDIWEKICSITNLNLFEKLGAGL